MATFTKDQEHYIEHEVSLRLHGTKFDTLEKSIDKLDNKLDKSVDRLDASLKHLDNKFMLMFSIVLGSIWLPAILHYLHVT